MITSITERSPSFYARVYGLLYILHFINPWAEAGVRMSLIVPGDAVATANNILASEGLFRLGFVGDLIGQTLFIFLVLTLYKLFKPVNKNQASLMVILALAGVPIAMLNLINHIIPTILLSGADYLSVFSVGQLQALALLFLNFHKNGVYIAMIFWGLWLLPAGYLVYKSGYVPRVLGVLLVVAGVGYLVDFMVFFLLPNYIVSVSMFTFIGEIIFAFWLLIKGVKAPTSSETSPVES
jgi:hypothetical protein